jgi:tRNA dimethylallyltransferase
MAAGIPVEHSLPRRVRDRRDAGPACWLQLKPPPHGATMDAPAKSPLGISATAAAAAAEPRCLVLAGSTAVGKSAIALRLAERLNGEIVSVDSMQVYRGLDIGTAKPSPAERARVPHHLIDVVDLSESFDAAQFAQLASQAVEEIISRGHLPILCGGTGLYFKALFEGLGHSPPANPALRKELEATPLAALLAELAARDPATHARIDRQNPRRVIRAVEVIRLTGQPFSEQRAKWNPQEAGGAFPFAVAAFGVARSPADMHQRIDARVGKMFRDGLVEETRALLRRGLAENPTAMQAIGYRQVVEHLRGERPLAETIALVKIRTHQFAKRQMTWFRRQAQLTWVEMAPGDAAEAVAERIGKAVAR